jgi:hypothetical protein
LDCAKLFRTQPRIDLRVRFPCSSASFKIADFHAALQELRPVRFRWQQGPASLLPPVRSACLVLFLSAHKICVFPSLFILLPPLVFPLSRIAARKAAKDFSLSLVCCLLLLEWCSSFIIISLFSLAEQKWSSNLTLDRSCSFPC